MKTPLGLVLALLLASAGCSSSKESTANAPTAVAQKYGQTLRELRVNNEFHPASSLMDLTLASFAANIKQASRSACSRSL